MQTVTSPDEARQADEAGVDALVVQSADAGGHWGTLTPDGPPPSVPRCPTWSVPSASATDLPVLAAGGVGDRGDVRAALDAGAEAVVVGTLLLLAHEAGTNPGIGPACSTERGDR